MNELMKPLFSLGFYMRLVRPLGRRGGLMVSVLDSGSSLKGPGSSPGWVIVLCSWERGKETGISCGSVGH